MTQLEKLDVKRTVVLTCGELDILTGLLTREWWEVKQDHARKPYCETIERLRQTIIKANLP